MSHTPATARHSVARSAYRGVPLLLAAALALATAVALLRIEFLMAESWAPAGPVAANEEVVRRYYDAANTAIATGKTGELMAVVSADVDLPPAFAKGGALGGRDALVARFLTLHAAQPSVRIVVRDVVADEDDVIARVAIEGAVSLLPPAVHPSWFAEDWLDGFHVRRGKVAAAWGATIGLSVPTPALSTEIRAPHSTQPVIGLTRLTLAPGARVPVLVGPGPLVVMPEGESLQVHIDGVGRLTRATVGGKPVHTSTERNVSFDLGPGEQVEVSAGVSFSLHNPGTKSSDVLVAAVYPASALEPVSFDNAGVDTRSLAVMIFEPYFRDPERGKDDLIAPSISWEPLARGTALVPAGSFHLYGERVVLPPGGVMPAFQPADTMLVAVEQGTVMVDSDQEQDSVTLFAGDDATMLEPGAVATMRNGDDVPAVVLTLSVGVVPPHDGQQSG